MLNGLNARQQELIEFDREHGLKSTYYLGRRVLGYQLDPQPHRELCSFVDDASKKNKLLLAPRGCFKTSIISQIYVTRRILANPNIRILLDSVALSNSQDNLKVVRRFFEGNEKLRELYGDFCSKNQTWNDTEFIVKTRTNSRLAAPTVGAIGIDKVQIGPHYDLIIADDLHNRDNYRTIEQVQKVKEHMRLVFGLLDPGGEFLIGGHRWSYTDAYSMVMGDTNKPEELEFAKLFQGNTLVRGAVYPDGRLYFPRVHDREHLNRQRAALGVELYAAMLDNEPAITGDGQKFHKRNFKRYKEPLQTYSEEKKEWAPKLNWYLTVDPGGRKKGNDYWVIFEAAIDAAGNKYFTRYLKKISVPSLAAEDIYRWFKQKQKERQPYRKIGFEVAGQQGMILDSIKGYIWEKYHEALPFTELVHSTDSKFERIESMAPEYEMGKIFHSEQMSEPYGLEDLLLKYGKAEDDVPDAAAMIKEIARAPKVVVQQSGPATLDDVIKKHLDDRFSGKTKIVRQHPILGSDF